MILANSYQYVDMPFYVGMAIVCIIVSIAVISYVIYCLILVFGDDDYNWKHRHRRRW